MTNLYTGKGDGGDTGFFDTKKRVSKGSLRVEALGALDEINSLLGVLKVKARKDNFKNVSEVLFIVQNDLFTIQAETAAIYAGENTPTKTMPKERVEWLEDIIQKIGEQMNPIKSFTVAGGSELSATFDYARAISRRVERVVVRLKDEEGFGVESLRYLNRLSSLLFALARFVNHKRGIREEAPKY